MKRTLLNFVIALFIVIAYVITKPMILNTRMSSANFGTDVLVKKGKIDYLFIGSSMFRQGIQFENVNNENVFLLGYNGQQPYMIYHLIKYLLSEGVQIDNLYCDMYVYSLIAPPAVSDDRIFLNTNFDLQLALLNEVTKYGDGDWSTYYEGLVSSNNEMVVTWPITFSLINSRYDRGASLPSKEKGKSQKVLDAESPKIISDEFDERQVFYLKEIVKIAKDNNINLCFIETPKYKKVTQESNYAELMSGYVNLLKGNKIIMDYRTYNRLSCKGNIITYNFDDDNASNFLDLLHLSGQGRSYFCRELFKIIGIS
jgi:hypothetical protein